MFHSLECAVMRMDTIVMRNVIKIRQIPEICSDSIEKDWINDTLSFDVDWTNDGTDIVRLNAKYCGVPHPAVQVPMEVLADKTSYMWLSYSSVHV